MVPVVGLEPTRYRYQRILSPSRLPIPSHRHVFSYYTSSFRKIQEGLFKNLQNFESRCRARLTITVRIIAGNPAFFFCMLCRFLTCFKRKHSRNGNFIQIFSTPFSHFPVASPRFFAAALKSPWFLVKFT